MKICPRCRKPPADPGLVVCPEHHEPYVDEANIPARLTDDDVDAVAGRILRSFKQEDWDRIATKVKGSFREDDWKTLGNEVMKSLRFHEVETLAKVLVGMWRFWAVFVPVCALVILLLYEAVGHTARVRTDELFRSEVTNQIRLQFQEPRISNVVASVAASQASNLLNQAVSPEIESFEKALSEKLRYVQTNIVLNLMAGFRSEEISGADTNRIAILGFSDETIQVFFKLDRVPLQGSLHGVQQFARQQTPMMSMGTERNMAFVYFVATEQAVRESLFFIQYLEDLRETNIYHKVEIREGKVFMDDTRIWFKQHEQPNAGDYHR